MQIITIKIYQQSEVKYSREISPDHLIKVIKIVQISDKPLNKKRAKHILSKAFPELGKVWYVWEHPDGWMKIINYQGVEAWAFVCRYL